MGEQLYIICCIYCQQIQSDTNHIYGRKSPACVIKILEIVNTKNIKYYQ